MLSVRGGGGDGKDRLPRSVEVWKEEMGIVRGILLREKAVQWWDGLLPAGI